MEVFANKNDNYTLKITVQEWFKVASQLGLIKNAQAIIKKTFNMPTRSFMGLGQGGAKYDLQKARELASKLNVKIISFKPGRINHQITVEGTRQNILAFNAGIKYDTSYQESGADDFNQSVELRRRNRNFDPSKNTTTYPQDLEV